MMISYSDCNNFESLYDTMIECFPMLSMTEAHDTVRILMLAPKDDEIKIGSDNYQRDEVISILRQQINEENNPQSFEERYKLLLEMTLNIIKHMNDGYITPADYQERQKFLQQLSRKEFLLFTILSLMKTTSVRDEEKENIISYKIGRLRELIELISKFTRNEVDVNTDIKDYEKAKIIYKMLKSLQTLGINYTISRKEKQNLGINHEEDEDLSEDYSYTNWIKRIMILQLRKEEYNNSREQTNTIDDLTQINGELGHSTILFENIGSKISELRGVMKKRTFDSKRFSMLEINNTRNKQ